MVCVDGSYNYNSGQGSYANFNNGPAGAAESNALNISQNGFPPMKQGGTNSFPTTHVGNGSDGVNMAQMNSGPGTGAHYSLGNGVDVSQQANLNSMGQYGNMSAYGAGNGVGMNGVNPGQGGIGQNMFGGNMPPQMSQSNPNSGMNNMNSIRANKLYNVMQTPSMMPNKATYPPFGRPNFPPPQLPSQQPGTMSSPFNMPPNPYDMKEWQDSLRALLPNINISFSSGNAYGPQTPTMQQMQQPPPPLPSQAPMPPVNSKYVGHI